MTMILKSRHLLVPCAAVFMVAASASAWADAAPFKLFDGHLHPVSDDQQAYPHAAGGGGPPGGAPPGGGQPGAAPGGRSAGGGAPRNEAPRAETDIDKRVLKWMDEEGVEAIADVQKRGTYGIDNSYTVAAADAHPNRVNAIVILDAKDANAPDALRALIKDHKIAGVRLTGAPVKDAGADGPYPWLNSPQALKLWSVANETGIVMDIMITNEDNSEQGVPAIIKLAKAYPNVRLVLDHALYPKVAGAPDYGINAAYATMAAQKNVYYKFTIINLDYLREAQLSAPDFVRKLVDVYGADHVLWGSDLGNSGGTYHDIVGRIVASTSKLSDAQKRRVLHDTGKGVFVRGGVLGKAAR
jgi:L-fuconolactonase